MRASTILLLSAALCLASGGALASEGDPVAKELFEAKCSACHATSRPLGKTKDQAGWERTVRRMQGKNPGHLSNTDVETIVKYLSEIRGR